MSGKFDPFANSGKLTEAQADRFLKYVMDDAIMPLCYHCKAHTEKKGEPTDLIKSDKPVTLHKIVHELQCPFALNVAANLHPCRLCKCLGFDYEVGEHPGVCDCSHTDSDHAGMR